MPQRYLETGRILTTHGVRGEVKIEPWADSPDFFRRLKRLYLRAPGPERELEIERVRTAGAFVLCKFRGFDTPEQAAVLRGRTVFFDRGDVVLPEGRFFLSDAVGMSVLDAENGALLGRVTGVTDTGAQTLFEAVTPSGVRFLVPCVPAFIERADTERGELRIHNMPGLIGDGPAVEEE